MRKIYQFISVLAVALCCMTGCDDDIIFCVIGCEDFGSTDNNPNNPDNNDPTPDDPGHDDPTPDDPGYTDPTPDDPGYTDPNPDDPGHTDPTPDDPGNNEDDNCPEGGCVACDDNIKNGTETDIDCGGSCDKCADDKACLTNADCVSDNCDDGICKTINLCEDGILSGDESDVDCGGSCAPCEDGRSCNLNTDCVNGLCDANICTSCHDMTLNGDETDVDCGGRCGATCAQDKRCNTDNDCESYHCVDQVCKAVECPDKAEVGELLINEIFANPDTSANMMHSNSKQTKYIELYNKSDKTLQLYNLSLSYEGNEIHAKGCVPPKTYLLIHPAGQSLKALDMDAKTLASDNIDAALQATAGSIKLVNRADSTVIHSASVPETEKGTSAGRAQAEDSSSNDEAMVPHSSVKTIEANVKNLYSPGLPNNVGFPMG